MGHTQEIGLRETGIIMLGHLLDHEMTHPTTVEVIDISMTVVTLGLQRKEECFFRETKTATVCQQPANIALVCSVATGSDECRHLLNRIFHHLLFTIH